MRILAFDLGTKLGWCLCCTGESNPTYDSGVQNLKGGRFDGGGMRFMRCRAFIRELLDKNKVDRVAFEEVRRHMGVDAAHVYGGLMAVLTEECELRKIPYEGIPVATIKKTATGKGNADKEKMVAAANKKWPSAAIESDDEADARWIAEVVRIQTSE